MSAGRRRLASVPGYTVHQRSLCARTAMPAVDAYDPDRRPAAAADPPVYPGPWYHGTDADLEGDAVLRPAGGSGAGHPLGPGAENRRDWVWLTDNPWHAHAYGANVYEVRPGAEGPWPWNGDRGAGRFVSPSATVVRRLDREEWAYAKKYHGNGIHSPASEFYQRQAAAGDPIYRGLARVRPGDAAEWAALLDSDPAGAADWLLERAAGGGGDEPTGGLGRHWSEDEAVARRFAQDNHPGVVLRGRRPAVGEDPAFTNSGYEHTPLPGERLVSLLPGTDVEVTGLSAWLPYPEVRWVDVDLPEPRRLRAARGDAYDAGRLKDLGGKPDQAPVLPGPWFHGSPAELQVGDLLDPAAPGNYEYEGERAPRDNWVFMDRDPRRARMWAGEARFQRRMPPESPLWVYRVEPMEEGPWPWNEYPDMGSVSPRARVVERRPAGELGDWEDIRPRRRRRRPGEPSLMERLEQAKAQQSRTAGWSGDDAGRKVWRGVHLDPAMTDNEVAAALDADAGGWWTDFQDAAYSYGNTVVEGVHPGDAHVTEGHGGESGGWEYRFGPGTELEVRGVHRTRPHRDVLGADWDGSGSIPIGEDEEGYRLAPGTALDLHYVELNGVQLPAERRRVTAVGGDYRMRHRPPAADYGASMDNPDDMFPDIDTMPNIYDCNGPSCSRESHAAIKGARGKPGAPVTIYRALPSRAQNPDGSFSMNTGDWVTPSLSYAQEHASAQSSDDEPYSIVKHVVPASSLFSEGNSIHEWGYSGPGAQVRLATVDDWSMPRAGEGFNGWRNRLWTGLDLGRGRRFDGNAPGSHYRAMSDAEYRAGVEAGEFRPLIGDHLFVTDDPDRLAGGAYGAKGGGHIVEFEPQPTSAVPSTYGGFDEIGVGSIPGAAVRRVWSWDGSDHVPARQARRAALTEDLASRLQGEFDAWWAANGDSVPPYRLHDEKRGPVGSWPYVEEFLRSEYPAAHRGLEMGWEEAGALLDHPDRPLPYVSRPGGADVAPYATGRAAVDEHGYDPAEVAAGMVLLHNRSMPARARFHIEDEARLRDIAVKRHRMQGRRRVAISDLDAYDEWYDHEDPQETAPEHPGPWYHYSPAELPPGTELVPGGGPSPWGDLYAGDDEMGDSEARRAYVWLSPDVSSAVGWAGETPDPAGGGGFIYRVEPAGDVYPWNDSGSEGWVADSATVVEALPRPWREAQAIEGPPGWASLDPVWVPRRPRGRR